MRCCLAWFAAIVALFALTCRGVESPQVQLTPVEQQLFEIQNQERESRGLAPLSLDSRLVRIARQRAKDLAAEGEAVP